MPFSGLARENLALALAALRERGGHLSELRIPLNGGDTSPDAAPEDAARLAREIEEVKPEYLSRSTGPLLLVGIPAPFADSHAAVAFTAIARLSAGRYFPLFATVSSPIAGFDQFGDRLVVVRVGDRNYSGASVPLYLDGVTIDVVDLATLAVTTIPVTTDFGIQSIAVALDGDRLLVRLRDVWNGADDKRLYFTCDRRQPACAVPKDSTLERASFPRAFLEVTASSGFRVRPPPAGFVLPPTAVARTVTTSPRATRVSWVERERTGDGVVSTLWESTVARSRPARVASGPGWLHAVWSDEDHLQYEAQPEVDPAVERMIPQVIAQARKAGATDAALKSKEGREEVKAAAAELYARERGDPMIVPVKTYRPSTRKHERALPGRRVRLWAAPGKELYVKNGGLRAAAEVPDEKP